MRACGGGGGAGRMWAKIFVEAKAERVLSMEQGAKSLLIILCVALVAGAGVIAVKPSYREAFVAIARGKGEESPIWKSNKAYYPDIRLEAAGAETTGTTGTEGIEGME